MDDMEQALIDAIGAAHGQAGLARMIGRAQPTIWYWLKKLKKVPAEDVLPVEKATGISRYRLRPDLYPRDEEEAAAGADAKKNVRTVLCGECDRRMDDPAVLSCTDVGCPRAQAEAA